jgi:hypothetical protein
MADSAAKTGLSNAASGSAHAGADEPSIVPDTIAGMEAVRDYAERNDASTLPNVSLEDLTDVDAVGPSDAAGTVQERSAETVDVPMGGKKRVRRRGVAVPQLLEATRTSGDPGQEARFRVFVIDTGWNEVAHKVLRKQIPMFDRLIGDTPTYWLDRKTSVALLRKHRELIGSDPILCVHDLRAVKRRGSLGVHGLRLHLGLLRSEDALTRALQMVVHFLARHEASDNFEAEVRSRLQLEGLRGAVAIMSGGTPHNDLLKV